MGIRFFCPNGHKLHVKGFQAGKRGICPHCGVSMGIPLQSTRRSSRQLGPPSVGSFAPPGLTSQVGPAAQEPEVVLLSVRGEDASKWANSVLGPSSSGTEARLGSSAAGPAAGGRIQDPLADPAEVVWYVRPPSGGQFGPAHGDLMRAWISEGRVTPDSLVWREGWRDWQEAQSVLPQFSTSEVEPELEAMIAEEVFSPKIGTERRTTRKRSRLSLGPWVVWTIGVALGLSVVAVVWVWFHLS